jgi:hypothetical protein
VFLALGLLYDYEYLSLKQWSAGMVERRTWSAKDKI